MSKKQIMQEIIAWSNSEEIRQEAYRWQESTSFEDACGVFYDYLQHDDGDPAKGIKLPSGVCYHEDEVDDREDYHIVFSIAKEGAEKTFYKISAFYSSWDGLSWEDANMTRVYPEIVTITKYSTKKPSK